MKKKISLNEKKTVDSGPEKRFRDDEVVYRACSKVDCAKKIKKIFILPILGAVWESAVWRPKKLIAIRARARVAFNIVYK